MVSMRLLPAYHSQPPILATLPYVFFISTVPRCDFRRSEILRPARHRIDQSRASGLWWQLGPVWLRVILIQGRLSRGSCPVAEERCALRSKVIIRRRGSPINHAGVAPVSPGPLMSSEPEVPTLPTVSSCGAQWREAASLGISGAAARPLDVPMLVTLLWLGIE